MARVCEQVREWVEEEVSKPVEEWEERTEEKCKKRKWYDPRRWVCWLVTTLVKVVRWVVVTVGKWVIRTICTVVSTVIDTLRQVFSGLWDVLAGIFTLDWRRILDGLIDIGLGIVTGFFRLLRVAILIDTVDFIITEINRGRLKDYVRKLLEAKYAGDTLDEIKDAIRLDHGAFGLRLKGTVYRTFLDSETPSTGNEPTVPNLVILHETGAMNLRALCGFEFDEGFWNRKRYKTLKKGIVVGGGGGGEVDNPISEDELDTYLSSRGANGPAFIVLPVRDGPLNRHIATAEDKGRELSFLLDFDQTTVEVTQAAHIVHNESQTTNVSILTGLLGRTNKLTQNPGENANQKLTAAIAEQCHPVGSVVFRYTANLRGLASNLFVSDCGLPASNASGITYIDQRPDEVWKYVLIHEFGHYFGLCHVDGLDRIMFSSKQNSWWRPQAIPNLLFGKGEPYFTFDEAKAAWKYVIDNFEATCLGASSNPDSSGDDVGVIVQ